MNQKEKNPQGNIDAVSFDKLLSISNVLIGATRYGKYCCLKEVDTGKNPDIFKFPVRIDAYIFVVCSSGLIELSYNLYQTTLSANTMFIYSPGTIMQLHSIEPSRLSIMVFTREFIDELGVKIDNVPLLYTIVREKQKHILSEKKCGELRQMLSMLRDIVGLEKSNVYYPFMVTSAFKSVIYRALYEINIQYGEHPQDMLPVQENDHFDRFMRLLEENYKERHSIKFYSEKMNLTPKYLSLLIKKVSGKLATEWIDDYIILDAKNLIKYSSMNIQEIAYALHFPNQSFFGKYFKRHTGLSPKAYRLKP